MGERRDSLPEETAGGWEKWVCSPIIQYAMSPREAKSILIVSGILFSFGLSLRDILFAIIKLDVFPKKEERLSGIKPTRKGRQMESDKTDWGDERNRPKTTKRYDLPEGFCDGINATVRTCIECGCLVSGGPTRCALCVQEINRREKPLLLRIFYNIFR